MFLLYLKKYSGCIKQTFCGLDDAIHGILSVHMTEKKILRKFTKAGTLYEAWHI